MGKHSQLGPIDPQMITAAGQYPARAIIRQFERGRDECSADPSKLAAWLPTFQFCGPSLLVQCEQAEQLAKRLVAEWLKKYMLSGLSEVAAKAKAEEIAEYFSNIDEHESHGLGIDRDQARAQGVKVEDLEVDQALQDAVLSAYHATMHTLGGVALKVIENHMGRAFVKVSQIQIVAPMQGNLLGPGGLVPPMVPQI